MTATPPPTRGSPVTVAAVVGRNVKLARERRGWDQERLAEEGLLVDIEWDAAAITDIEGGTHDITVSEKIAHVLCGGIPGRTDWT